LLTRTSRRPQVCSTTSAAVRMETLSTTSSART
jgi:hypothetical protein